jgi:hypothetical protein
MTQKVIIFHSNPEREGKNYPVFDKVIHRLEIRVDEKVIIKCIDKMRRIKLLDLLSPSNWLLMSPFQKGLPKS